MTANRDLPLPLVIITLVVLRGSAASTTTSQDLGMNSMQPLEPRGSAAESSDLPPDDYYDYLETTTLHMSHEPVTAVGTNRKLCEYNTCQEMQTPCAVLAASTGCLCPGVSLDPVAPEAPFLKKVSWEGSQVVVRWCAPHSNVTSYRVTVGGKDRHEFGENKRSGPVGAIDHATQVCVVAVNSAGVSKPSCMMYQPTDNSVSLKAGLIGGALGFLLLFSLAVLLWRHRKRRKSEARISTQDTAETQQMENRGGADTV
ncbi:leucine-rich repeat neuronal protein 4 [Myripristis murdjan]|uniref:leucine-rich repeat neuronal protein 4 n=1 Tax=Myripristis murdjan TaxID=586833 RepID=UPI001175D790|nr:leucine-rich repeat neuronal protein 4-like [Myripristis murdjan]